MHYHAEPAPQTLKQRLIPALFMLLFCGVILGLQLNTLWLNDVKKNLFSYVYQPVNSLVTLPMRSTVNAMFNWRQERKLLADVKKLADENNALRAQLQQYGHFQAENRRLRMLMDSLLTVTDPVLIAELLNTEIDGFSETVMINKGSHHDVYLHQPVIDPYGLVGQVTEVYDDSATVMLISDARSRVPAYIERTFQRVIVLGSPERGGLEIPWQRHESDIQIGDRLISSGLGGVFPRGYPVAEVVAIDRAKDTSFLGVTLKPIAHLSSMLEVLLLNTRTAPPEALGPPIEVGPMPQSSITDVQSLLEEADDEDE